MIVETLRTTLYPLGFIANFLFAGRFLVQWIQSEKRKESVVSYAFWRISFLANIFMCLHGYIQLQYPICLIQGLNASIAWRNLNLMTKHISSLKTTLLIMVSTVLILTLLFFFQGNNEWMRPPSLPWSAKHTAHASLGWHLAGFFGMLLFASRYWIQWWFAEKHRTSYLGKSFWWISCIGAFFSFCYALRLNDPVNIIGFSLGIIPYVRNLMLSRKKQTQYSLRPLSKFALFDKVSNFCAGLHQNFENMREHMIKKFGYHSIKKESFSKQMEFQKGFINNPSLFFLAGEQSGDILGGDLIKALKKISPECDIYGVGGPEMKNAGLTILHSIERFQVMGFTDVFKALPRLYVDFKKIQKQILQKQPCGVVLIDYPDFNMLLAKALRKKGYQGKVIHYVCPSVWAWRKKRIYSLEKTLDHLLSILPFEKHCFSNTSLPITYVGHPLVSVIDQYSYSSEYDSLKPLIAIFPGSRYQEIELNLPLQLEAAKRLGPNYTIAVSVARPDLQKLIQKYTTANIILVPSNKRYELMRIADCALATSGTIVLELGLHSTPTVVTYQLKGLNYLLGRYVFRIHLPFYSLINIICEKEIYPEFIHKDLSCEDLFLVLKNLVENPEVCRKECGRLRQLLTSCDASSKAATIISQVINEMSLS